MVAKVALDEQLLKKLQQAGELRVENMDGVPIVLMTVDARNQLQQAVYDDSDLTEEEMLRMGADQLNDPADWGAPEMDIYDTMEGIDLKSNGSA